MNLQDAFDHAVRLYESLADNVHDGIVEVLAAEALGQVSLDEEAVIALENVEEAALNLEDYLINLLALANKATDEPVE